jgi:hypothetical protein
MDGLGNGAEVVGGAKFTMSDVICMRTKCCVSWGSCHVPMWNGVIDRYFPHSIIKVKVSFWSF